MQNRKPKKLYRKECFQLHISCDSLFSSTPPRRRPVSHHHWNAYGRLRESRAFFRNFVSFTYEFYVLKVVIVRLPGRPLAFN